MSYSKIFKLGHELTVLPVNSAECAMGNYNSFKSRLEKIKNSLESFNLGRYYYSLEIFEELLVHSDVKSFLQNRYDELNNARDDNQKLVYDGLENQDFKNLFKLGVAIGQIQLNSMSNILDEETYSMIESMLKDLLKENVFPLFVEEEFRDYIKNNFTIPMNESEIINLIKRITQWLTYSN